MPPAWPELASAGFSEGEAESNRPPSTANNREPRGRKLVVYVPPGPNCSSGTADCGVTRLMSVAAFMVASIVAEGARITISWVRNPSGTCEHLGQIQECPENYIDHFVWNTLPKHSPTCKGNLGIFWGGLWEVRSVGDQARGLLSLGFRMPVIKTWHAAVLRGRRKPSRCDARLDETDAARCRGRSNETDAARQAAAYAAGTQIPLDKAPALAALRIRR